MKKITMSLIAIVAASSMMAAVTPHYQVEAGYDHGLARVNRFYDNYWVSNYFTTNEQMDGFHVGGNIQLDFMDGPHIPGLIIGLNYQFLANDLQKSFPISQVKDAKVKGSAYAFMHTLQIPVRFQYTYQIDDDWRFFLQTGPQVRLHAAVEERYNISTKYDDGKEVKVKDRCDYVSGEWKIETTINGAKTKQEVYLRNNEKVNCFDLSWGLGMGFGWKWLNVSFTYDFGLLNLYHADYVKHAKHGDTKICLNSDALAVTLGFRIK